MKTEAPEPAEPTRRRSTVREKVSFAIDSDTPPQPAPSTANEAAPSEPAPSASPKQTAPEAPEPRKAGWWSRRFGGG